KMKAPGKLLSLQLEFKVALGKSLFRIANRLPCAIVPQQHRAAAILAFRDGAFEIAIVERVVLDMNGKAFFGWHEAGAARDRPAFQYAIHLKAQIVMQPARIVFLHHEAFLRAGLAAGSLRLTGAREIALLAIGLERHCLACLALAGRFAA